MKMVMVFILTVLLVSVMVVQFRRSSLPPPLRLQPASAPVFKAEKKIQPSVPKSRTMIDISGPLRGRAWAKKVIPSYPLWAEEEGVTGTLRIHIRVNPEGQLRSFMPILQTSRYPALDDLALQALQQWEFVVIPNGVGDQEGVVTFRFILANTPVPPDVYGSRRPFYKPSIPGPGFFAP